MGKRDVKCCAVHGEALSNTLFYRSSQCGRTLVTPPLWELSGLQGLPFSLQLVQPR